MPSPKKANKNKKTGPQPQFPRLVPPPGFGDLPTVTVEPRGKSPRDGFHNWVHARSGSALGASNHDLDRGKRAGFKPTSNEPLNHPEFESYYNYEGERHENLTPHERRILEMSVHYPHIANGIMRAPMLFRTKFLLAPTARQPHLVQEVFGSYDLFSLIIPHLIPRYEDISSLAATCRLMAHMYSSFWMHMDTTNLDFQGWDTDSLVDVRKEEVAAKRVAKGKGTGKEVRIFKTAVIVSPVRPEEQGPVREVMSSRTGYPVNSRVEAPQEPSFGMTMKAHYKFLHFAWLNGHAIKHLVLHGMPWLDVLAIRRVAGRMTKLETLSIHQCFLLNFGETQSLLRAINALNGDRSDMDRPQPRIALDFSPFYYKGPHYRPDGTARIGEYGLVPEELDWLETQRAITSQLLGIWDLCREGSQDLFTPGTGFRAYLERLPIRSLTQILKCIAAIHDFTNNKRYAPGTVSNKLHEAMKMTLWQDLIITSNGKPMLLEQLKSLLVLHRKVTLQSCVACRTEMPAYFFQAYILNASIQSSVCHGCQMADWLSYRNYWRMHADRRKVAESIFKRQNGRELHLSTVLRNIARDGVDSPSGEPQQDAILCRPGAVDIKFLDLAEDLWDVYTVRRLDDIRIRRMAEEMSMGNIDDLPASAREEKEVQIREWRREVLRYEFQLGLIQREVNDGSVHRLCRSWELNIREERAARAIEKGLFANNGPMHIFNFKENTTSMLGRSGGLLEYWEVSPNQQQTPQAVSPTQTATEPTNGTVLPHQRTTAQPSNGANPLSSPPQTAAGPSQSQGLLPHQRPGPGPQAVASTTPAAPAQQDGNGATDAQMTPGAPALEWW
ncbi:hypothetical protein NUW58_g5878 [Xylaria curta]|uniref:Uncharacterized protein n=1 Tax=Xylaria curta TaxID=42375 RepID=A0ACC1P086_9PEZI|nr:hypothetical protein NUW58_g5878 [Xylaria curta]